MCVKCHKCEMDSRVKYYSMHVKCYSTRVTWNFTCEVHIYTLQETWSTQTRDVNNISLCHVSLHVHTSRFEVINELYCRMKKEANYFSGTADLWSSCTSEPYLCFTIHYVDTQWNLQTHCLQAHYLPDDHIGVQLQDALSVTLEQWDLNENKFTTITTDSASNIKLACQLLK